MLSERFEMRFPTDLLREFDDWRRAQPDLPARAEAIRRLIEAGLGKVEHDTRSSKSSPPGGAQKPRSTGKRLG